MFSNTLIFTISTFSSKFLGLLMISFYTRMMTTGEMATGELIINVANLLAPIASVCIGESIIRFGLDKSCKKSDVFSSGILVFLLGFIALMLFIPLLDFDETIKNNTFLVILYVLCSCTKSICAQFVRSRKLIRLFAFDGIFSTIYVVVFNVLALAVFDLGVMGYVMSVILADILSIIFLFTMGSLHKFIKFDINKTVLKSMVIFALPMIPNAVSWWITNVSDLFFVTYFCGKDQAGLYNVAYKIPTMITALSLIFSKAWQISAFSEDDKVGQRQFFTKIFKLYQAFIMIAMSGLIMLIKPITNILIGENFYDSWKFVPILVIGVGYSCFVTFLGSIYMTKKKNVMSMVTTMIGAIINVVLNLILIPKMGPQGAAVATFFSFFIVFIIRAIDTRRLIPIDFGLSRLSIGTTILFVQSMLLLLDIPYLIVTQILCCVVVFLIFVVGFIKDKQR